MTQASHLSFWGPGKEPQEATPDFCPPHPPGTAWPGKATGQPSPSVLPPPVRRSTTDHSKHVITALRTGSVGLQGCPEVPLSPWGQKLVDHCPSFITLHWDHSGVLQLSLSLSANCSVTLEGSPPTKKTNRCLQVQRHMMASRPCTRQITASFMLGGHTGIWSQRDQDQVRAAGGLGTQISQVAGSPDGVLQL